ncbi:hypothetical protein [Lentimonas sp. CC4]|uniref:hypothetical protein n=1 Tax=Lentimonas sp. CC4 TaxID=2676099 RepID=UPI00135412DC|nr:hypothetical protein [Lentimonas sp. CC4]CAA7074041.1 Unannotated [Lentimonas sp. CC4]
MLQVRGRREQRPCKLRFWLHDEAHLTLRIEELLGECCHGGRIDLVELLRVLCVIIKPATRKSD